MNPSTDDEILAAAEKMKIKLEQEAREALDADDNARLQIISKKWFATIAKIKSLTDPKSPRSI